MSTGTLRRPGAIAALASLVIVGLALPQAASASGNGSRHDTRSRDVVRDVARIVAGSLDAGGFHRKGRGLARRGGRAGSHTIIDGRCHVWHAGGWTVVRDRVCVEPARTTRIWVPPVHGRRSDACGRRHRVVVEPGYWRTVTVPARYDVRARRVWNEGRWQACGAACDAGYLRRDGRRAEDRGRGRGRVRGRGRGRGRH